MCVSLYAGSHYVDKNLVQKSLSSYNRVIREKYVSSDNNVAIENENAEQILAPTNVCKFICSCYCSLWNYINFPQLMYMVQQMSLDLMSKMI